MTDREHEIDVSTEDPHDPSIAEGRVAQDNFSDLVGPDAVDEDEQEEDDALELDQTELEELGLTLDDPHQPESE